MQIIIVTNGQILKILIWPLCHTAGSIIRYIKTFLFFSDNVKHWDFVNQLDFVILKMNHVTCKLYVGVAQCHYNYRQRDKGHLTDDGTYQWAGMIIFFLRNDSTYIHFN